MLALCVFTDYWQDPSIYIAERISDRLHCSPQFDFLVGFLVIINKNPFEYAQAHPGNTYTHPESDKPVVTAHLEEKGANSVPGPFMTS